MSEIPTPTPAPVPGPAPGFPDPIDAWAKTFGTSVIRTVVPALVSYGVVQLARVGITVDDASAVAALDVVVTGVYYTGVRWLEEKISPRFGWLLGLARKPVLYASKS